MYVRSANKLWRYSVKDEMRYGLFVHSPDDRAGRHEGWLNAAENPNAISTSTIKQFNN